MNKTVKYTPQQGYPPEMIQFLKENVKGKTVSEISEQVNLCFGIKLTSNQIIHIKKKYGFHSGNPNKGKKLGSKYTPEHIDFIRSIAWRKKIKEITVLFNNRFQMSVTIQAIRFQMKINKISNNFHFWTPEMLDFLKNNIQGRNYKELTEHINGAFNISLTRAQVIDCCGYMGYRTVKKVNGNYILPVGSERKFNNYIYIKVAMEGKYKKICGTWKPKHHIIWEQANGHPVPKGGFVIFLDGNKNNFEIDNLACLTSNEVRLLDHYNLRFNDKEMTRTGIDVIRLRAKITNRIIKEYGYVSYTKHGSKSNCAYAIPSWKSQDIESKD